MELVTVKTFDNSIDAHLLKIELENHGIMTFIQDEGIVTMNPLYSNAVGGIKVRVAKEDTEKARAVLFPKEDGEHSLFCCPNCGSNELILNYRSMKGLKGMLATFLSLITTTYPIYYNSVTKCLKCDAEFRLEK